MVLGNFQVNGVLPITRVDIHSIMEGFMNQIRPMIMQQSCNNSTNIAQSSQSEPRLISFNSLGRHQYLQFMIK